MKIFAVLTIACLLPFALTLAEETPDTATTPVYAQPVLLTSVGQAADVLIMKGLSMRAGLSIRYCPQATADSLKGIKTLLLVAGGSSKGLGAAKIDPELEMDRVKALIKSAEKKKIPILVYHIGGEARRGALSDPFNQLAAEAGTELVVVSSGDKDGFFKEIAEDNGASYTQIEKQVDIVRVLKEQFGIE
ncbi:DUF6305 family protein [bacterium]|nr:DUF6305 family protein [bacterium]